MRYVLVVALLSTACGGMKSPTYPSENPGAGCRYLRNLNNQWTLSCVPFPQRTPKPTS